MPVWFPIPGWLDVLDIAIVAALGWLLIRYMRATHARAAVVGLAVLGAIYFFATRLELEVTASILRAFFAVLVLILVVVFQDDLRRVFEQLGRFRPGQTQAPVDDEAHDSLVRTVARLASTRTGALIVLPGEETLDRYLEGGVRLAGRLSEPLLLSIFDASSPGHDGAVLIRGDVVERFAIHLPLSGNHAELGAGGTRHAAALGLSERCDAICIAVSEERGTVSVARGGQLRVLSRPEDLALELRGADDDESDEAAPWWYGRRDALFAIAGSVALWVLFVFGSDLHEATVTASVRINNLPDDLVLESVQPGTLEVKLRGQRRDFLLTEQDGVSVEIDAYLARLGRRTFSVSVDDVKKPNDLSIVDINPERVRISLRGAEEAQRQR